MHSTTKVTPTRNWKPRLFLVCLREREAELAVGTSGELVRRQYAERLGRDAVISVRQPEPSELEIYAVLHSTTVQAIYADFGIAQPQPSSEAVA